MIRASLIASFFFGFMTTLAADDREPLYLILGAVPQETNLLSRPWPIAKEGSWPDWNILKGDWENRVVVSLTGVGKSYTGMVTALFLQEFKPDAAFRQGPAPA